MPLPNHQELGEQWAKLSSDEQVPFFVNQILPSIVAGNAHTESVIYIIGNTGAGKSTLLNSLLKQDFIIDNKGLFPIDVVDKSRPYAQIGKKTADSCTLFPEIFSIPDTNYSCADFPGLRENRTSTSEMQQFAMEFTNQIVKSVKAVIIVISKAELDASRSMMCKALFNALAEVFRDNHTRNLPILFVFNSMGDKRLQLDYYMDAVNMLLEQFKREHQELLKAQEEINKGTRRVDVNLLKQIDVYESLFLHTTLYPLELIEDKLATLNAITQLYSDIRPDNSIVWSVHNDPEFRQALLDKLDKLPTKPIPNSHLKFEPREAIEGPFLKQFLKWVHKELDPLAQLIQAEKKIQLPLINMPSFTRQINLKRSLNALIKLKEELESLHKITDFSDVNLENDPSNTTMFSLYPYARIAPYELKYENKTVVPFAHIHFDQDLNIQFKETDSMRNDPSDSFIQIDCEKKPIANKINFPNTIVVNGYSYKQTTPPQLAPLPDQSSTCSLYTAVTASYQSQTACWSTIPTTKIGKFRGFSIDHPAYSEQNFHGLFNTINGEFDQIKEDLTLLAKEISLEYLGIEAKDLINFSEPAFDWKNRHTLLLQYTEFTQNFIDLLKLTEKKLNKLKPDVIKRDRQQAKQQFANEHATLKEKLQSLRPKYDEMHKLVSIVKNMFPYVAQDLQPFFDVYGEAYQKTKFIDIVDCLFWNENGSTTPSPSPTLSLRTLETEESLLELDGRMARAATV